MDPSSLSDPHNPPSQYTPFPTFPTSNNNFASGHVTAPNHPFLGGQPVNPNPFNHVYQPQPQAQPQPQPQPQPQAQPQPQSQPQAQPQPQEQPQPQAQPQTQPQPQPQPQPQTPPSQAAIVPWQAPSNPLSYTEMICGAIAAMNEPDGSSRLAIARYIERSYTNLSPAHGALMTHHLKSLKNTGVLTMVKKSYKLAGSSPPQSVAVAAAAVAASLAAPRSEVPLAITGPVNPVALSASGSASQPQKRGRGRPPKPKPEASQQQPINVQPISQQPINVQPNVVPSNGLPSRAQPELSVTSPVQVVTQSAKRGPGRPRKDGSAPIPRAAAMPQASGMAPQASGMAVVMKRRGRPLGRRAAGRQRKPTSVSATASVFPLVANGARRPGRPRRVESGGVLSLAPVAPDAPAVGQTVAAAPGMKRGRGRPPKIGGVMNRLITKPRRGRGRPVGRPRKNPTLPITGATGTLEAAYGELKKKFDLASEKAKEILNVLNDGIASGDVQAVAQARQELEGLIPMLTLEPRAMEEVKAEEAAPQTEAETQGEEHGPEREGGGDQAQPQPQSQPQPQPQPQTEAEAMQEALF